MVDDWLSRMFRQKSDIDRLLTDSYDPFMSILDEKAKADPSKQLELLREFRTMVANALTCWGDMHVDSFAEKKSYASKYELKAMRMLPELKIAFPKHAAKIKIIAQQLGKASELEEGTTDGDIVHIYATILIQMQQMLG